MAAKRRPEADLSSSLDGWDVAETSGDMLAGWDDGPSSPSDGSSGSTASTGVSASAHSEKKPRARSKPVDKKRSAAAKPSSRGSGGRKQDCEPASTADIGEAILEQQLEPSVDQSPAAVDSIAPVALDDGAPDAGLLDVGTGDDSAVDDETSSADSLSIQPDLAADADGSMGTRVTAILAATTDHESWAPVVDEDDLAIDDVDDLIDGSGSDGPSPADGVVVEAPAEAAQPLADAAELEPDDDSADGSRQPSGDPVPASPHRFEAPGRSQPTASAPAVSRPMPVSEPEPIHEDGEDDGLQMFLGDERDYVIEQDLRSRTRAEAAARNAFRLHRPGAGAMLVGAAAGAAAGMEAAGSIPRQQNGSVADLSNGGLDDRGLAVAPQTTPTALDEAPTVDYPQGSGPSVDAARPDGGSHNGHGAVTDGDGQADSSPALDYDGLLNDMNADNSDDYLNVDSPSVIDDDEVDEDETGTAGDVDGDLEEEHSPEEYAERIASLSKSTPSQPIEDPSQSQEPMAEDLEDGMGAGDDAQSSGAEPTDADKCNGKPSLKDKFHAFIAQAKSEIVASSDDGPDGGDDGDGTAAKPSHKFRKKPAEAPAQNEADGRGPLSAARGVVSKIRAVKRSYRIAATLGLVFAGLWTSLNVPAAMDKGGASGEAVDEGSVKVAAASWNGSAVEVTLQNDSEMIAHVSGRAVVRSWSPSVSPVSWIGARVTATCEIPSTDVDPGASRTVEASKCDAKPTGVWHRVKATLDYE